MIKILQARLQQYVNRELPEYTLWIVQCQFSGFNVVSNIVMGDVTIREK